MHFGEVLWFFQIIGDINDNNREFHPDITIGVKIPPRYDLLRKIRTLMKKRLKRKYNTKEIILKPLFYWPAREMIHCGVRYRANCGFSLWDN